MNLLRIDSLFLSRIDYLSSFDAPNAMYFDILLLSIVANKTASLLLLLTKWSYIWNRRDELAAFLFFD